MLRCDKNKILSGRLRREGAGGFLCWARLLCSNSKISRLLPHPNPNILRYFFGAVCRQVLFTTMCLMVLGGGTSANAAPDHSWKGFGSCPTGTTPPYCLTDLDPAFKAYQNTRIGNQLDTTVWGLQLSYNKNTLPLASAEYIGDLSKGDLFLMCGNRYTNGGLLMPIPFSAFVTPVERPGKVSISATSCGNLFFTTNANFFNTSFSVVPVGSVSLSSFVGSVVGTTDSFVDSILGRVYNFAIGVYTPFVSNPAAGLYRKLHFKNNVAPIGVESILQKRPVELIPAIDSIHISHPNPAQETRKIVVMVHGWNSGSLIDQYTDEDSAWPALSHELKSALDGSEWKLYRYHWGADADTGPSFPSPFAFIHGTRAAEIGHQHGQHLGELLKGIAPNVEKVHFIAHSAGSWVARAAVKYMASKNPDLKFQVTLLDPFIPGSVNVSSSSLDSTAMQQLQGFAGRYRLENYWAADPAFGTNNNNVWASAESNVKVDLGWFNLSTPIATPLSNLTVGAIQHSWPVEFYADSISLALRKVPQFVNPYGNYLLETMANTGWRRSLFFNEPQILRQPTNQEVPPNVTATFSVKGNIRGERFSTPDNAGINFRWQECNANNVCVNLGINGPTLTIGPVTLASNGRKFRAVAENSAGIDTSNIVTLTVQSAATAPSITAQPQSQTAPPGAPTVQFDVVATGTNPTFQWRKDGAPISGETSSSLLLYNITAADAGSYTVVVTNSMGSATSTPATLTVSAAAVAPTITLVTPATLPGLILPQRQLITLDGTGFTTNSRLTFSNGAYTYTNRVPLLVNNQLQYNIAVGNPAQTQNWTVKVLNGAQVSNAAPFTVNHSSDTTLPQIKITGIERTAPGIVRLSGTATDDVGVTGVTWSSDQGASGMASYSFGRWNIPSMTLAQGANVITVSAADAAGHVGTDIVTLSPAAPGAQLTNMQLAASWGHTLALKTDGGVWAWGNNYSGQLGDGSTIDRNTPVQVIGLSGVVAVATSDWHSLALKSDGSVWVWGHVETGALMTMDILVPIQVVTAQGGPMTGVTAIAAGNGYSLAVKSDGSVWAWGINTLGQLGDGTSTQRNTPVQVIGLSAVVAVVAGDVHSLALKADGSVQAWGGGYTGLLQMMAAGSGVVALAAGGDDLTGDQHSLVLKADGSVWGWGSNSYGQLGDGSTIFRWPPVQAMPPGSGVVALAAGGWSSLALKADGSVLRWGSGGGSIPVQVPGLTGVVAVAYGDYHSVAIKSDGTTWAWGSNGVGNLGDGTTIYSSAPVQTLGAGGIGFLNLATSTPFYGTPAASLSVTSLTFTMQGVGSTSAVQTFTLTNSGTGPLSLNNIAAGGDFAVTHNCPASLAAGASCTVNVTFTPLLAGARNGLLTIWSDAPDSPLMVSLTGTGNGTAVATLSITPSTLNDTGITASQCGPVACSSADAIALNNAQDGMVGRDANAATNSNTDGKLGFSFTAVQGGCVQDNVTGLIWEVKTADGGLRDWAKTYTNYDSTTVLQKYNGTAFVAPTQAEIDATTNSVGFKNGVNTQGLCGYSDWRLPTADELQSIVDYSVRWPGPTIDASWFPNTMRYSDFWSASPVLKSGFGFNGAWEVSFGDGGVGGDLRSATHFVRLVRAGQSPVTPRYTVSVDGQEVTDNRTKLIWRRCAEGMSWNGSTCAGSVINFAEQVTALQHAAAQADSTGLAWRLPNIKELSSIIDRSRADPAIDSAVFPVTRASAFWSATPRYIYYSFEYWYVSSSSGFSGTTVGSVYYDVRLVRDSNGAVLNTYAPPQDGTTHFSNQTVGSTSAAQIVTFTNSGTVALGIGSIAASGDFLTTHSCPATLAPGANCSINVQFAPTAPGSRNGILSVTSPNGTVWSNTLLNGTGMSPVLVLSSSALNFAPQILNTASTTQTIALTNTGNAALNISSIAASADYTVTHNCSTSLTTDSTCTISVTFTPTAAATRNGVLTIISSAAGGPYTVGLSGTGVAVPGVTTAIPGVTTTVTAIPGNAQATVSFAAPASDGGSPITGYTVTSNPAGGVDSNAGSTALTHTITGLNNGTSYTFTVTATNSIGTGAVSVESNTVIPNKASQTIGAISFLPTTLNVGGTTTVSATATSALAVSFSSTTPSVCTISGVTVTGVTSGACTIAANQAGDSNYNAAIQVTQSITVVSAIGASAPSAPTIGTAVAGNAQAWVSFTTPANNGGSPSYTVTSNPGNITATGTTLLILVNGLTNGTSYTFTVTATSSAGTSPPSASSNVVTPNRTFTVSTIAGTNGSISPATQTVIQGHTASFTITPGLGGYTASASGCGGSLVGNIYTTGAITADCTVTAISPVLANLVVGWNLIGNSVNAPLDVATLFGDATKVSSVWKLTQATSKWAYYTPTMAAPNLATYAASKGYDALTTINGGEGFWINARQAFTVLQPVGSAITTAYFQDQPDPTQNKLGKGWNLIGMGDSISPSAFNLGLSVTPPAVGTIPINVTTLWVWDSVQSKWYFYAPKLEARGDTALTDYLTRKGFLDFTANGKTLGPGVGFWVNKP